jgi:hypothetical protein|tara:strand:+ start:930 stop:1406 length:477 start_codon:yes stop_codon:yes gene_type:complete
MATISLKDITESSGRPYLPNGTYTLRVVEAERKVSAKGNDMVAVVAEVVEPTEVNGPNGFVEVGGVQVRDYPLIPSRSLKEYHKIFDLPDEFELEDYDEIAEGLKGKAFKAVLYTKQEARMDEISGDPMIDPITNQPLATNRYNVERRLEAAPDHDLG